MGFHSNACFNLKKVISTTVFFVLLLSIFVTIPVFGSVSAIEDFKPTNGITEINWTINNSPYYIEYNITINSTSKLNIDPGVEVRFNGSYYIFIEGELNASGEPGKTINFTSNFTGVESPGDWGGIRINSTGVGVMNYCNLSSTLDKT